jgi:hypothetical protein
MSVLDSVRLLIYRVHEKGLEVFMLNEEDEKWTMPEGWLDGEVEHNEMIELDPIQEEDGKVKRAVAIEGDWHDIPSIRNLLKRDVSKVKDKLKSLLPGKSGAFVAVKDTADKVVPGDDQLINELEEIISEKNSTKYI